MPIHPYHKICETCDEQELPSTTVGIRPVTPKDRIIEKPKEKTNESTPVKPKK